MDEDQAVLGSFAAIIVVLLTRLEGITTRREGSIVVLTIGVNPVSLNRDAVIVGCMTVSWGRVSGLYLHDHPVVAFCPVSPQQCEV